MNFRSLGFTSAVHLLIQLGFCSLELVLVLVRVGLNVSLDRNRTNICIRARGGDAWACLEPALQCLCDGRACCPALAMQLVIFVLEVSRFTGAVTWLF